MAPWDTLIKESFHGVSWQRKEDGDRLLGPTRAGRGGACERAVAGGGPGEDAGPRVGEGRCAVTGAMPYLTDVKIVFGILDPLSPLVCISARLKVLNPRNLPYYVCIWVSPPPRVDVI